MVINLKFSHGRNYGASKFINKIADRNSSNVHIPDVGSVMNEALLCIMWRAEY